MGEDLGEDASDQLTRRPQKALTAQRVKAITAPGKYFDGHGLYLRVEPNGSRFWVQRIVIRGKRSEIGRGSPALVSLAGARAAALENRKIARSGGDPLQARREARAILTFEEAARQVHTLHLPTWRNEKHGRDFITSLETYVFPKLGKLKVTDITTADVLAVLMPIWTAKAETARRVRQRIGTVLKWTIAKGWRQDNPAENISQAFPPAGQVPLGEGAHRLHRRRIAVQQRDPSIGGDLLVGDPHRRDSLR